MITNVFLIGGALAGRGQIQVVLDVDLAIMSPAWGASLGLDLDDSLALAMLSTLPQVDILSLTATHGNTLATLACRNVHAVAQELNLTVPVACGGGYYSDYRTAATEAAALITKTTREAEGSVVWLGLGSATNFAEALHRDPTLAGKVSKVALMGTRFDRGWDLNRWADPAAFDFVMRAGRQGGMEVQVTPAEVCLPVVLTVPDIDSLVAHGKGGWITKYSFFLKLYSYLQFRFTSLFMSLEGAPGTIDAPPRFRGGSHPWDVVAAVSVAFPSAFARTTCHTVEDVAQLGPETACGEDGVVAVPRSADAEVILSLLIGHASIAGPGQPEEVAEPTEPEDDLALSDINRIGEEL